MSTPTGPLRARPGVVNLLGPGRASERVSLFRKLETNLLVRKHKRSWWQIHELIAFMYRSELEPDERERLHIALGEHHLRRMDHGPEARYRVDEWKVRASREFLRASTEERRGKNLLLSLARPAKKEGNTTSISSCHGLSLGCRGGAGSSHRAARQGRGSRIEQPG